jgi:O-antigen/teichoic acid export membrane protein
MARLKRFAHSLLSGYLLLGVNVLYTLASVRMALHYLSTQEFGLWANITTMATYIALLDFGLSGSAARILIDYKDHPERGKYGGVIQTDVLVGLSQAGLILIVGTCLACVIGPVLHIPEKLQPEFFWLVMGQCCITATMFVTRIIALVLNANSRFDVTNYSGVGGLAANFGMMWWSFARGDGVFSMLWGQAASVIMALTLNWIGCFRLKLFPRRGEWGRPSWERFRELFAFGRDLSLYSLGAQFVNASQVMLLTRLIGLDAAAVWSVYTRAYTLLVLVIGRIFDFSTSALAEMMVRNDREKLLRRVRDIAVLSVNLAVVAGALFAVDNSAFVQVWKGGTKFQIPWSPWNDLLLAFWLVISTSVRVHSGLVGQAKAFRFLRYLYFLEGLVFISLTVLLHRFGGITLMLALSIFCSLCFTFPYGLWRTLKYFHLSWSDLARWHRDTLVLAFTVAPVAVLVCWFARNLQAIERLMVESSILGIWSAWMFLRYGLGASLRAEASRRAPAWVRPIFMRTGSAKTVD